MKVVACMLFFVLVGRSETITGRHVRLETIEDAGQFAVAVAVPSNSKADRAIVTYQFWHNDSKFGRLLLTRSAVVELAGDNLVMADAVLASRRDIKRIEVVLVKDVQTEQFDMVMR